METKLTYKDMDGQMIDSFWDVVVVPNKGDYVSFKGDIYIVVQSEHMYEDGITYITTWLQYKCKHNEH